MRQRYEGYMGWREVPEVRSLRFEDLILEREAAFGQIWIPGTARLYPQPPRRQALAVLSQTIAPRKSGPSAGQTGNWREHFTGATKRFSKN